MSCGQSAFRLRGPGATCVQHVWCKMIHLNTCKLQVHCHRPQKEFIVTMFGKLSQKCKEQRRSKRLVMFLLVVGFPTGQSTNLLRSRNCRACCTIHYQTCGCLIMFNPLKPLLVSSCQNDNRILGTLSLVLGTGGGETCGGGCTPN